MGSLQEVLKKKLDQRQEEGLMRTLRPEKLAIDFFSNDYLGLARSQDLSQSIEVLHQSLGIQNGSTGSRLLSGNSAFIENVERKLSDIFDSQACLIFNSGYAANLAVLSAVAAKGDTILYDNLAHASLKDGARLSLATRHSFHHNDLSDLERKLKASKGKRFIVAESVYSMDGDLCPLHDIVALAEKYDASVVLDEAHTTGVIGPQGAGYAVKENLHKKIDLRIYTFGKGMGVHGACVAGSETLIRYLINFSRPFIYTTALPQHDVASILCAFEYLAANLHLQDTLKKKVDLYNQSIASGLQRSALHSAAIQTLVCPGNERVKAVARGLQEKGFDVRPILYPTVPKGRERLRICLHTFNSDDEIRALTRELGIGH